MQKKKNDFEALEPEHTKMYVQDWSEHRVSNTANMVLPYNSLETSFSPDAEKYMGAESRGSSPSMPVQACGFFCEWAFASSSAWSLTCYAVLSRSDEPKLTRDPTQNVCWLAIYSYCCCCCSWQATKISKDLSWNSMDSILVANYCPHITIVLHYTSYAGYITVVYRGKSTNE